MIVIILLWIADADLWRSSESQRVRLLFDSYMIVDTTFPSQRTLFCKVDTDKLLRCLLVFCHETL